MLEFQQVIDGGSDIRVAGMAAWGAASLPDSGHLRCGKQTALCRHPREQSQLRSGASSVNGATHG